MKKFIKQKEEKNHRARKSMNGKNQLIFKEKKEEKILDYEG